jgi:hypothetical protein
LRLLIYRLPKLLTMRTSRTEDEILTLLDEYDNSNMTVKEFAEVYEISDATFYNWRNIYRNKAESKEKCSGFASLEVVNSPSRYQN